MKGRYFGTDGMRARWGTPPMTEEYVQAFGYALAQTYPHHQIFIAHDGRFSAQKVIESLCYGLKANGIKEVMMAGMLSTPDLMHAMSWYGNGVLGVMVTASHNPFYDNGIKVVNHKGKLLAEEYRILEESMVDILQSSCRKYVSSLPLLRSAHQAILKKMEDFWSHLHNGHGKHIIFDGACGALSFVGPWMLRLWGYKVTTLYCTPTGVNINKQCGVLYPGSLQKAVVEQKAYMGVSVDGDGDRLFITTPEGYVYDGDDLLVLLAKKHQPQGIIGTVMSNEGLAHYFHDHNILFQRVLVGDKNVKAALNDVYSVGGEPSGHMMVYEHNPYGCLWSTLCDINTVWLQRKDPHKRLFKKHHQYTHNIPKHLWTYQKEKTVRQRLDQECARVVIRPSGTEPVVRIMLEDPCYSCIKRMTTFLENQCHQT